MKYEEDTLSRSPTEQGEDQFSAQSAYDLIHSYADYFDGLNTPDDSEGAAELRQMVQDAQREGQEGLDGLNTLIAYLEDTIQSAANMPNFQDKEWKFEKTKMLQDKIVAKLALEQERKKQQQELSSEEFGHENVDKELAVKIERSERFDAEASQVQQLAKLASELQKPTFVNDPDIVESMLLEETAALAGCDVGEVETIATQHAYIDDQAQALGITPEKQYLFETLRIATKNLTTWGPEATQRYLEEQMSNRYGIEKVDLSDVTDARSLREKNVDIIATTPTNDPNLQGTIQEIYSEGYEMPGYQVRRSDGTVINEINKDVGARPRVNAYRYNK
jgi:hypothetical protein